VRSGSWQPRRSGADRDGSRRPPCDNRNTACSRRYKSRATKEIVEGQARQGNVVSPDIASRSHPTGEGLPQGAAAVGSIRRARCRADRTRTVCALRRHRAARVEGACRVSVARRIEPGTRYGLELGLSAHARHPEWLVHGAQRTTGPARHPSSYRVGLTPERRHRLGPGTRRSTMPPDVLRFSGVGSSRRTTAVQASRSPRDERTLSSGARLNPSWDAHSPSTHRATLGAALEEGRVSFRRQSSRRVFGASPRVAEGSEAPDPRSSGRIIDRSPGGSYQP